MSTKITGAEFKRFYADPVFWPTGAYHDDVVVTINGVMDNESDLLTIDDASVVVIDGGFVLDLPGAYFHNSTSFESHFKRWKKLQNTGFLLVEAPKDKIEAVKAAIKAAGGKVAK